MKFIKLKLILFLVGFLSIAQSFAQIYTIRNYGHKDGLNVSSILTVEESEDGHLWFGTDGGGIIRYDGKDFDYLSEVQGRSLLHINHISIQEDKILFSTLYDGAFEFDYKDIRRIYVTDSLNLPKAIFSFKDKSILLKKTGLSLYQDTTFIEEKEFIHEAKRIQVHQDFTIEDVKFILTSLGNFVIYDNQIFRLEEWLLSDEILTSGIVTIIKNKEGVILIDKDLSYEITVLLEGSRPKFFVKEDIPTSKLEEGEYIIKSNTRKNKTYLLTNLGGVIIRDNLLNTYESITPSTKKKIHDPTDIIVDNNEDIWITTLSKGIYRVSIEAFTKLEVNSVVKDENVRFIAETRDNKYIFTIANEGTYLSGKDHLHQSPIAFKKGIIANSYCYFNNKMLLATNKGVYQVVGNSISYYPLMEFLNNKPVSLIFTAYGSIWYSVFGEGLVRFNPSTGESRKYSATAGYFYNVLANSDSTNLFLGSNNGVFKYYLERDLITKVESTVDGQHLGYYVGNSVKDKYGNMWFSFDNGIMGIKPSGEQISITEQSVIPSLLIYTLNADNFGNLYVGSNIGITVIKLNREGEVLASNTYDSSNDFLGYETNMRASYENEAGEILIGTIQGIYKIQPWLLMQDKIPNKPIVYSIKLKNQQLVGEMKSEMRINRSEDSYIISFKSINSKSNFIQYSYRIKGKSDDWSEWSQNNDIIITNLPAGKYSLEVRATIDRRNISEITSLPITVIIPFYKNKYFVVLILVIIIFTYIIFVDRTKNYDKKNIIISRDIGATKRTGTEMLIIGALTNTVLHIIASRIDGTIINHDWSAVIIGLFVLATYGLIKYTRLGKIKTQLYLGIGFLILLGYNIAYAFLSDIHPFYILNILMITFITSYAFKRLRSVILLSVVLLIFSILTIFFTEEEVYNPYLFIIIITLAGVLMVFMKYMRNKSLGHLIFTSGIVNRGNVLVVAFDLEGTITYASENIEFLLGIDGSLKGKKISMLNNYYPSYEETTQEKFQKGDITTTFKDGEIFLTPLITAKDKLVYYQWSCKEFSNDVRVILGQDVTDKINFENYYELIVNNAEDLIFQADVKGRLTFINEKGSEVLGRAANTLIGKSIYDLIYEKSRDEMQAYFNQAIADRVEDGYVEFQIIMPGDSKKWLGVKFTTMYVPGVENKVQGFLGLARDITEDLKYKTIIEEQNKDITDSINYARRIQFNMLPRLSDFEKSFDDFFILYKPRDIVSGDFFWLKELEDKTVLIVADCTGHGVPGSFMASLGINIISQIVEERKVTNPGKILTLLDENFTKVLPRDGRNRIRDGMEIVVCVFNHDSDLVEYSTAGGRFIVANNYTGHVSVIKGQTKHIGDEDTSKKYEYSTEMIPVTEDHTLYLLTDGFPDQFGGEKDKKLTFKKFIRIIDAVSSQDLKEQSIMLQEYLEDWVGEGGQTDDITVVGVKGLKNKI